MRLTGLRGVDNTVLLEEFGDTAAAEVWTTAVLEVIDESVLWRGLSCDMEEAITPPTSH